MNDLYHAVFVQQGDSNTLQVMNKELYNVVEAVHNRSGLLLRETILFSHRDPAVAEAEAQKSEYYRKAVDFSDELDAEEECDDYGDDYDE